MEHQCARTCGKCKPADEIEAEEEEKEKMRGREKTGDNNEVGGSSAELSKWIGNYFTPILKRQNAQFY